MDNCPWIIRHSCRLVHFLAMFIMARYSIFIGLSSMENTGFALGPVWKIDICSNSHKNLEKPSSVHAIPKFFGQIPKEEFRICFSLGYYLREFHRCIWNFYAVNIPDVGFNIVSGHPFGVHKQDLSSIFLLMLGWFLQHLGLKLSFWSGGSIYPLCWSWSAGFAAVTVAAVLPWSAPLTSYKAG